MKRLAIFLLIILAMPCLAGEWYRQSEYTHRALSEATRRALEVYGRKPEWKKLVRTALTSDFSWESAAGQYADLYADAVSARDPVAYANAA